MNDGFMTHDIAFAAALMYIFGEVSLTKIEGEDGQTRDHSFYLDVPSLDAAEYQNEFQSGSLAIADLLAFTKLFDKLRRILRDLHRSGDIVWCSPSWVAGRG